MIRFGYQTVIWGREIKDLELVLDTIAAFGYQGVEFAQSPANLFIRDENGFGGSRPLADLEELLKLLKFRGLTLVGLSGGALEERIQFCGKFRDCFLYVEDVGESEWKALSQERPFRLALHPHWFMKVQRLSQARKKLKDYS